MEDRRCGSRRRGFILAVTFGLMFVMVLGALVLANQGRALYGFTIMTQNEALEGEAAQWAYAEMRGILQGELPPSILGLPPGMPPAAAFNGTPGADVNVSGKLTWQKPNGPGGPEAYSVTTVVAGVSVPSCHALATATVRIAGQPDLGAGNYTCMYLSASPYGLLAPAGTIQVKSVRSTRDCDGADGHVSGLMANVAASGAIDISGQLNGRAYSSGPMVKASQGGILYPSWPNPAPIPDDFTSQLNDFKTKVLNGLSSGLTDKFGHLHDCLHEDFSSATGEALAAAEAGCLAEGGTLDSPYDVFGGSDTTQPTVDSPGSTDFDSSGGTLTVGTSLRIPDNENDELTFNTVNVNGDLLMEDSTVLHVKGDLTVSGAIRLGQKSTLVVDGRTRAQSVALNIPWQIPVTSASAAPSGERATSSSAAECHRRILRPFRTRPFPSPPVRTRTR